MGGQRTAWRVVDLFPARLRERLLCFSGLCFLKARHLDTYVGNYVDRGARTPTRAGSATGLLPTADVASSYLH